MGKGNKQAAAPATDVSLTLSCDVSRSNFVAKQNKIMQKKNFHSFAINRFHFVLK
jgi:hypothetical protein